MIRFRMRRANTKVLLILAILVFGVFIRIGYAFLSQDLTIGGLAIASKNTWDVHFVDDSIVEDTTHLDTCSGGDTCSRVTQHATIGQDGVSVSFGVVFHVIGDYYEFTVDVVNNGTIDAMLNEVVKEGLSGNDDYLDFTVTYADGMPIAQYDQLLKCGGTEKLKVKVTFVDTPDQDVNTNLEVTANYIQADNNMRSRALNPEARIRTLNTLGVDIADDDPDHNLRFIGENPNNYVWFNGQKWRIIGVFNGKLKIVQDSIGSYSFDSSGPSVNNGLGVNVWGPTTNRTNSSIYTGADLMKLLNPGYETNIDYKCIGTKSGTNCGSNSSSDFELDSVNNSLYWNAQNGNCYTQANYQTSSCDFRSSGLQSNEARNMIDDATWYLGSNPTSEDTYVAGRMTASYLYNMERSDNAGNACNSGTYCTDNLNRMTSWQGKVGLIYPSDYAYATGGGNTYQRSDCLSYQVGYSSNVSIPNWSNTYTECMDNDWLLNKSMWTLSLSPRATSSSSFLVFTADSSGCVYHNTALYAGSVRPVVYLKSSVTFTDEGNGSYSNPFVLRDLANVYTVTFDANGGIVTPTTKQVDSGSSIGTLPTPTEPLGKVFDGWYAGLNDGAKITSSYVPTGNVTIYAHWTPTYDPETRIRALNTLGESIADDDPDGNLRFIGANPNNYVRFNNQTWRIIGVFDGKLKLVQESIGSFAWDTSKKEVNNGNGINQWGPNNNGYTGADLMKLLNPRYESNTDLKCNTTVTVTNGVANCGDNSDSDYSAGLVNNSLYWNASSGKCYVGGNYKVADCNFTTKGLSDTKSKNMIDDVTWYLGSNDSLSLESSIWDGRITASTLYNWERSNNSSKQCSGGSCTDSVERTTRWQGKVGLLYPSDYAYAVGNGNTYQRSECLSYPVGYVSPDTGASNWQSTYTECKGNDWLLPTVNVWSMTSRAYAYNSYYVFSIHSVGYVYYSGATAANHVRPTVYLKSNVKFTYEGTGTSTNPFVLKMVD